MKTEPKDDSSAAARWTFNEWMAASTRISVVSASAVMVATLVFDISAIDMRWNYLMWGLNSVGLVSLALYIVTLRD
jgi:hypothetical protein